MAQAVIEVIAEEYLGLPCQDARAALLARRIVGAMLDAGWTMPGNAARAATQTGGRQIFDCALFVSRAPNVTRRALPGWCWDVVTDRDQ